MAEYPPLTVHRVTTTTDGKTSGDVLEFRFDADDPSLSYGDGLSGEWLEESEKAQVAEMQSRYDKWLKDRQPPAKPTLEELNQAVTDAAQAAIDAQRRLLDAQAAVLEAGGRLDMPVAVTTIPDAAVIDAIKTP